MEKEMKETQKKLSDTIAEINNDIELANLKMNQLLENDKGICFIIKENKTTKQIDFRMDKTLFDMYWNIREKAFNRLKEII
jgi:hypothetical protein